METYLYLELGDGRVTVAIQSGADNVVELGVAFCSPYDQFIKATGRTKSLERLKHKKDFYIRFVQDEDDRLNWQVRDLIKFIVSGKWVTNLDFETELGITVQDIITESVKDFSDDIVPMTVHTSTIPTWAKRAVETKNFY